MDVYIKPKKKITLEGKAVIYVKDLADVVTRDDIQSKVKEQIVSRVPIERNGNYLVSVTDIVKSIKKILPDATINNLGEMDTFVQYYAKKQTENKIFKLIKITFVALVLFTGSATAIMAFYTDSQIAKIFQNMYFLFFGVHVENPFLIEIPYAIGLFIGIVGFFNHFWGRKLTKDPTPIQVEMDTYELSVESTIIDSLSDEEELKKEDCKHGTS